MNLSITIVNFSNFFLIMFLDYYIQNHSLTVSLEKHAAFKRTDTVSVVMPSGFACD